MGSLHYIDIIVIVVYLLVVAYLGIAVASKKTKTLGDFFVAGGKWGPLVAFLFNFAAALAGAEAVVVSGAAYSSGLSGVWMFWSMLFATPVYYLAAVIYKRARVFNTAEFFELRFGHAIANLYAVLGVFICINFIGMFELGAGKVLSAVTGLPVDAAILICCTLVGLYVATGGAMAALYTDLFQGLLCIGVLCFGLLPFLWNATGGLQGLQKIPAETWSLHSENIPWIYIVALLFSGAVGSIVMPNILCWIAIAKDEKAGTQCSWASLWKRVVTLFFAFYGLMFFLHSPGLSDPELAWGSIMKTILPVGILGLMVASFAAALMSSVDTVACTASTLIVDYIYRRGLFKNRSDRFYMRNAKIWAFLAVFLGYITTRGLSNLIEYIELVWSLFAFIAVPLYFGILWRRANRKSLWAGLSVGALLFVILKFGIGARFEITVFVPTLSCAMVTWLVSLVTRSESEVMLNRFYCILSTPIGKDAALIEAGIDLPAMKKSEGTNYSAEPIEMNPEKVKKLYDRYAQNKIFGPSSNIEIRKEAELGWFYRGFFKIVACCFGLILIALVISKVMQHFSKG